MNRPDAVEGLTLRQICAVVPGCRPAPAPGMARGEVRVTGVSLDSRRVRPGDLYAALPGANVHGVAFAAQACSAGAVAVLTDPVGLEMIGGQGDVPVPVLVAVDPRAALAVVSAAVYDRPSSRIDMVGVTGTNGKTTTAYLLESAWRALDRSTGLVGTIESRVGDESLRSVHTTPESPDLQGLLALMVERGVEHCVMEVSSHAVALHRIDAITFDTAVFTNLSQDHLDFHGTMEAYFEAKARLFTPGRARRAVVCIDDAWGRRLAAESPIPVVTLATPAWRDEIPPSERGDMGAEQPFDPRATMRADWYLQRDGEESGVFSLVGNAADAQRHGALGNLGPRLELTSALPGAHNEVNTALAALVLLTSGLTAADTVRALSVRPRVPGRMERVDLAAEGEDADDVPLAVVDFAHTPEAIEATLSALRTLSRRRGGRLVAVVGAGGDRDPGKRPLMGAAAASLTDVVVVTDDNPRHEDPAQIRAAIANGARDAVARRDGEVEIREVPDRAEGIASALEAAGLNGVVAVLGKGHETTQVIGTTVHPFDDREALVDAWASVATTSLRQEGR